LADRKLSAAVLLSRLGNAGVLLALAIALAGCGGGSSAPSSSQSSPSPTVAPLSAAEASGVVQRAATAAAVPTVIAVSDRSGNILAVFRKPGAASTAKGNFSQTVDANELAVSLAHTAAFFSNGQAPLSSRTVRFISGIHFPPGVAGTGNAALYGIENTNRGCVLSTNYAPGQAIPPSRNIAGTGPGLGIITGKADVMDSQPDAVNPGGVPIFRGTTLVGGVGVVAGAAGDLYDVAEFAAVVGAGGLPPGAGGLTAIPNPLAPPAVVFIDGIALPFVNNTSLPAGFNPDSGFSLSGGTFVVAATSSPGLTPDGYLVNPADGPIGGLKAAEVQQIIQNAITTANLTRAVIRLPLGSRAKFVIAVADLDGTIIGLNRMPDATIFSIDVAASKARNMIYFNSSAPIGGGAGGGDLTGVPMGTAVTNRTISFGAQPLYPPGISGPPGPFFNLYLNDTANPCGEGFQPSQGFQLFDTKQSGIVFFPGSVGLFRNGKLVGGLGVSGDGVEQDDFVTNAGSAGFEAPTNIRADQVFVRGVRLPYLKFPRNPTD